MIFMGGHQCMRTLIKFRNFSPPVNINLCKQLCKNVGNDELRTIHKEITIMMMIIIIMKLGVGKLNGLSVIYVCVYIYICNEVHSHNLDCSGGKHVMRHNYCLTH